MAPAPARRRAALAALGASLAFVAVALVLFGAGGNDDSHITYWSAWTLATRGEIVSYNGVPLEQSSSLTLVLLLGALHALTGIAVPTLGWIVSMAAGVAGVALLAWRLPIAGLLAGATLPLLYWSTSGMESSLAALLLLAVAVLGGRFLAAPSLSTRLPLVPVLAAAAACRPEMPVLLLCTAVAVAAVETIARSPRRRAALELVGWVVAIALLLALARLAVVGVPAPNPAMMKTGGFALQGGKRYLLASLERMGWLLPAAAAAGLLALLIDFARRRRPADALLVAAPAALAGIAFCLLSGGDWMPAGRFVVPVVPLLALLAGSAIQRLPWSGLRALAVVAVVGSGLWATLSFARLSENTGRPHLRLAETEAALEEVWGPLPFVPAEFANRAHLRDAALVPAVLEVVEDLGPTEDEPIVLVSGQAGMVPYYVFQAFLGKARFYDLYGLTDDALVRCLPKNAVHHSIWGVGPGEGWLLNHPEALERCGLPRPDVLFSVNITRAKREAFRKAGYEVVYEQSGSMRSPHSLFPGGGNPSSYIAVRSDLRDRVSLPIARTIFPLEDPGERFRKAARRLPARATRATAIPAAPAPPPPDEQASR